MANMGRVWDRKMRNSSRYPGADQPEAFVPMATVYATIAETINPSALGLDRVDDRRWVRVEDERTVMLHLQPMKGRSVAIEWGVSLPYVPHKVLPRALYHRTPRSARLDLYLTSQIPPAELEYADVRTVGTMRGVQCVIDDATDLWSYVHGPAMRFWSRTDSVAGVLAEAVGQIATEPIRAPRPAFVAACAAARLGDVDRALAYLDHPSVSLDDDAERSAARALFASEEPRS